MTTHSIRSAILMGLQLCLVALLFGFHDLSGLLLNNGDYTPFSVGKTVSALTYDETQLYAPGPKKLQKDRRLPTETDMYELRNQPNGYPVVHTLVIGTLASLTKSLPLAWMLLHVLLPLTAWILIYLLLCGHMNGLFASLGAWLTLILPFGPQNSLLFGKHALIQPVEFMRISHPALSFTVLLAALCFTAKWLSEGRYRSLAFATLFSGLLFYTYYYYMLGITLSLGLLLVSSLIARQTVLFKRILILIILTSVLGSFHLFQTLLNHSLLLPLLERVGRFSRLPYPAGFAIFIIFTSALIFAQKFLREPLVSTNQKLFICLLLALISAAGIGMNIHLITGYNPQNDHFWNRLIQPIMFLLLYTGLCWTLRKSTSFWPPLAMSLGTVALILCAFYRQYYSALNTREDHLASSPKMQLLNWLDTHTEVSDVVGTTDPELIMLLPTISGNFTYVPAADRTLATNHEILIRYLTISKLEQRSLQETKSRISQLWSDNDRLWLHIPYVLFNQSALNPQIISDIDKHWNSLSPIRELANRRLNYLVVDDPNITNPLPMDSLTSEVVFTGENWRIIRFTGKTSEVRK